MKNVKLLTKGRSKKGFLLTVASILAIGMLVGVVVRDDIIKSKANEIENANQNSNADIHSDDEHFNNRMEHTVEENGIYKRHV